MSARRARAVDRLQVGTGDIAWESLLWFSDTGGHGPLQGVATAGWMKWTVLACNLFIREKSHTQPDTMLCGDERNYRPSGVFRNTHSTPVFWMGHDLSGCRVNLDRTRLAGAGIEGSCREVMRVVTVCSEHRDGIDALLLGTFLNGGQIRLRGGVFDDNQLGRSDKVIDVRQWGSLTPNWVRTGVRHGRSSR